MSRTRLLLLLTLAITVICLVQHSKATDTPTPTPTQNPEGPNSDGDLDDLYEDSDIDGSNENEDSDEYDGEDDDLHDLDDLDTDDENLDSPDADFDWDQTVKSTFADKSASHTKDSIQNLAYKHLIYEEVDSLSATKLKHQAKETKLTDDEISSLSNAIVVKAYIDHKFGDRVEILTPEALTLLDSRNYDTWMDDMPDSVTRLLGEYMPAEDEDL